MGAVQLITGEVKRVVERQAQSQSESWTEYRVEIADWGFSAWVQLGREDAKSIPSEGERVAFVVAVRAYVKKDGKAGYGLITAGRSKEAEAALFGSSEKALRAAN